MDVWDRGQLVFRLPYQNGVHYVYKAAPAVTVGQTITMHFAITGGTATARVRLFLQQRGDTAQEPYKRWWSVTYVELHEGEFTLTAPLSPDQWTSVFGQGGAEVPNEFNTAISQLANVGFTAARLRAMAFMSRAGTSVLSLNNTHFRNEPY